VSKASTARKIVGGVLVTIGSLSLFASLGMMLTETRLRRAEAIEVVFLILAPEALVLVCGILLFRSGERRE